MDEIHVPSDIAVAATYVNGSNGMDMGKQAYDNEPPYMYDFSFVVPINTYNDLGHHSTSDALTVLKVKRVNM